MEEKKNKKTEKSELTKENIIQQTIKIINEYNGNTDLVTIRKIAQRAGIGIGLINHYFGSKDQLIEICVQKIIGGIIHSFQVEENNITLIDLTKQVTKQVIDYLVDHPQISKISILSDLNSPHYKDHSMSTAYGFAYYIAGRKKPTTLQLQKGFFLVAILQESFLRKETLLQDIDIDFQDKNKRDQYIDLLIDIIME